MKKSILYLFIILGIINSVYAINITDGLVSYYNFDDTTNDIAGTNNIIPSGSVLYSSGKINNGYNTSTTYGDFTSSLYPSTSDVGGVSFWLKLDSYNCLNYAGVEGCMILIKSQTNNNTDFYGIGIASSNTFPKYNDGTLYTTSSNDGNWTFANHTSLTLTDWYHIVVTANGTGTLKLYINGAEQTKTIENGGTPGFFNYGDTLRLATFFRQSTSVPADRVNGVIDELGLWDRYLTQSDVDTLYNNGSGLNLNNLINPTVINFNSCDDGSYPGLLSQSNVIYNMTSDINLSTNVLGWDCLYSPGYYNYTTTLIENFTVECNGHQFYGLGASSNIGIFGYGLIGDVVANNIVFNNCILNSTDDTAFFFEFFTTGTNANFNNLHLNNLTIYVQTDVLYGKSITSEPDISYTGLVSNNVYAYNATCNATYLNTVTGYSQDYTIECPAVPSPWCYQEFANVSTLCGGLNTGSYAVANSYIYINYTKPTDAQISSVWQVKYGSGLESTPYLHNLTLTTECWNQQPLQLRLYSNVQSGRSWIGGHCYNGTEWYIIEQYNPITDVSAFAGADVNRAIDGNYSTGICYQDGWSIPYSSSSNRCDYATLWEEGMWWNITCVPNWQTIYNPSTCPINNSWTKIYTNDLNNCDAAVPADNGTLFSCVYIPPANNEQTFNGKTTTDLNTVENISAVENFTVASSVSAVQWTNTVDLSNVTNLNNVVVTTTQLIVVNVTAVPELNSSAGVSLYVPRESIFSNPCDDFNLYYTSGYYTTLDDVIANGVVVATSANVGGDCTDSGICTNVQCNNGVLTFTAQHFDGFGVGLGTPEAVASCQGTQSTIFAAFSIIALFVIVGAAFLIIMMLKGGNFDSSIVIASVVGFIAVAIVVFVGYLIISQVSAGICLI